MNIDEILKNYKQNDESGLIEYIENIVQEKYNLNQWDKGLDGNSQNLTTMLMYEYASSIERITEGRITSKGVIDKLSAQMGKLRFGDFKKGMDDIVQYDSISVTSDDYKRHCRVDTHFGAHAITYKDSNNEEKEAVVLFDNKQTININNNELKLSGIDLDNLSDIRETIFHEWTHKMEKCKVHASELSKDDIIYKNRRFYIYKCGFKP